MLGAVIGYSIALVAVAMVACFGSGCGTWADSARTTIEVGAVAVDVADHSLAAALTATCASVAELPAETPERAAALDACLVSHHYDTAIDAIRVADHTLRAAQAAVDAGERADDKGPWLSIAACLAASVQEVLAALDAAGVDVPPALTTGVSILAGITGTCAPAEVTATAPSGGAS